MIPAAKEMQHSCVAIRLLIMSNKGYIVASPIAPSLMNSVAKDNRNINLLTRFRE